MSVIKKITSNVNFLKKIETSLLGEVCLLVEGAGVGEKAIIVGVGKEKSIFVATDIIEMQQIKNLLEELGKKVGVLSVDVSAPVFSTFKDQTNKIGLIKNIYDYIMGKIDVLIVLPEVLLYKFPKKISTENCLNLEKNKEYNFNGFQQKLIKFGYKKCEKVEKIGDFSVKGDILDVFLVGNEYPTRFDFFGDTLEKIYSFDFDMEKLEDFETAYVYPLKLYFLSKEEKNNAVANLKNCINLSEQDGDALIKSHTILNQILEGLQENIISDDVEFLRPFLNDAYSVFEILPKSKIFVSEPKRLAQEIADISKSVNADIFDYVKSGDLTQEHYKYFFDELSAIKFYANIVFSGIKQSIFTPDVNLCVRTIGSRKYVFDYKSLVNDLFIYERSRYKVVLFAGSKESAKTMSEYLINHKIYPTQDINFGSNKFQVCVSEEKFASSFSFLDAGIVAIGTDDLIKKTKSDVKNISSKNKKRKVFYLPKVGDFVVHETHGIGKCVALEKLNFNGNEKDYFVIEYLGGDKLYLPSEQADLISAYMGGDVEPKLNKIGGEQFAKIKQKVKESVSKLAINLLEIYAKREKSKGFVYSPDNSLMEEFENAFPFEETDDQKSAIADIKSDMEGARIMDRLVCGDVGYGKTEVALRAIYKAVLDGRQVAFLCPTTILSEQHYKTCKSRLGDFMVNVAVLNRFKTASQKAQILKDLKDGKIDVIIGTHSLLAKDVEFKDLGLLVLDEEQRFGVADKEKIKELRQNIDVLTLSATPIPRTLNMALTGIRDISIIATPPKERIAVKTFVQEESDTLIANACKKELERGGQVLIVFNRVATIYEQAERIRKLVPNARIGVAHGQMPERLLEETIMSLYNQEFDILVATTLIESGIDLPLANTLVVLDADRLGLSELYQLRGRIGRSDRTAYAYFTYNPSKLLTIDAYKRLDAILEYTELGSGFKIAMRDLEIRGAGDILGKQQHGHLEKVGYDMYCKLLESAVKELKGETVKEYKPIKIDIFVSANIPNDYVVNEDERIKLYSRISAIASDSDFEECVNTITESYGQLPKQVTNLLKIAYIKNLGARQDVKRILIDQNSCKIFLYKKKEIMSESMNKALNNKACGYLRFDDVPIVGFDLGLASMESKIDFVLDFLKESL